MQLSGDSHRVEDDPQFIFVCALINMIFMKFLKMILTREIEKRSLAKIIDTNCLQTSNYMKQKERG